MIAEWLVLGAMLLIAATVLVVTLYRERGVVAAYEADRLLTQARIVDENLIRQLEGAGQALAGIATELSGVDLSAPMPSLRPKLKLLTAAMPGVSSMLVLDREGNVVESSLDALAGKNFRQREYFAAPRQGADAGRLHVSPPFVTTLGTYVVVVSRAMTDAHGAFCGVVTATLDADYFAVVLRSVLYAPDMEATLTHGDGKVFLKLPADGKSGTAGVAASGAGHASGDERIVARRTIDRSDLRIDKAMIVSVSRSRSAVYRPWWEKVQQFAAMFAILVLGSALALSLHHHRRRTSDLVVAAVEEERRAAASLLRHSEERLSLALESSGLALFDWDIAAGTMYHSAQAAAMRGEPAEEITAPVFELQAFVHPADLPMVMAQLKAAVTGAAPRYHAEYRLRRGVDDWLWIRAQGRVVQRDAAGRALRLAGTYTDINDSKIAEGRLRRLAEFDTLTGLPNRALFNDRLRQGMARAARGKPMALLFLDIDHFKTINDTLGHEAGDQLLKIFAGRMKGAVRQSDTVARLAGDEFTIILEQLAGPGDAEAVARKLVESLRQPVALAGKMIEVTVSIGVAMCASGESDDVALLRRADEALYEAKRRGRDGYHSPVAGLAPTLVAALLTD